MSCSGCSWTVTEPSRIAHFWKGAQSPAPATQNHIWTYKRGPGMVCFVDVDLEICLAPQQRALFWLLNFQRCSKPAVFCKKWLRHVRATTARNFFSSHLARWLRTRRFSEPTFRPSAATNQWKKQSESRLYLFAHLHLLSSHSFSSLIFSILLFSSLTLPTSAFPSVHTVGSLAS